MPHTQSVEGATLELIKSLQCKPYLDKFYLAGGTALALYLGHRKSVDIDLFSNFSLDVAGMVENIHQDYNYQLFYTASNIVKGSIDHINVDILAHRYALLEDPVAIDGVLVLSEPDIIAMKLNAISTSGQRSKDFIDIYYLLPRYSVGSMLDFYRKKYNQQNDSFVLKSLIYFNDVDLADWPMIIQDPKLKWPVLTKRLQTAVLKYINNKKS